MLLLCKCGCTACRNGSNASCHLCIWPLCQSHMMASLVFVFCVQTKLHTNVITLVCNLRTHNLFSVKAVLRKLDCDFLLKKAIWFMWFWKKGQRKVREKNEFLVYRFLFTMPLSPERLRPVYHGRSPRAHTHYRSFGLLTQTHSVSAPLHTPIGAAEELPTKHDIGQLSASINYWQSAVG